MFFLLAIASTIGYTFHNFLISRHARKLDGLSLAIYRNLSLAIGMSPLFFFISIDDLKQLPTVLPWILAGGFFGALSVPLQYLSWQRLPLGITSAFTKVSVLFLTLWSFLFLNESLSPTALGLIFVILIGIFFLAFQKHHMPHLNKETEKGIAFALGNAIFVSLAFFFMSKASREVNPLMAGYFWEVFIGIFALLFGLLRQLFFKKKIQKVSLKKLTQISKAASLTTIGTGAFALAIQYGPIGIASAIGATATVILSLLSQYYNHEKLNRKQWLGILIIILAVIGLKLINS